MDRSNRTEKLYLQAFREIRQFIVDQNLQPGDSLPTEQQLCQKLGVSRNVLREAIKSMEVMGLIEACPGRGTELREFSDEFFLQNVLCLPQQKLHRFHMCIGKQCQFRHLAFDFGAQYIRTDAAHDTQMFQALQIVQPHFRLLCIFRCNFLVLCSAEIKDMIPGQTAGHDAQIFLRQKCHPRDVLTEM